MCGLLVRHLDCTAHFLRLIQQRCTSARRQRVSDQWESPIVLAEDAVGQFDLAISRGAAKDSAAGARLKEPALYRVRLKSSVASDMATTANTVR